MSIIYCPFGILECLILLLSYICIVLCVCVCLHIVVSNTCCVVFLFCCSSSYVASFFWLSIIYCLSGILTIFIDFLYLHSPYGSSHEGVGISLICLTPPHIPDHSRTLISMRRDHRWQVFVLLINVILYLLNEWYLYIHTSD